MLAIEVPQNFLISPERTKFSAAAYITNFVNSFISEKTQSDEAEDLIQHYTYSSFGKPVASANTFKNRFTYTNREWDEESGLYYYRARYYDPNSGRFLTEDPHPGKVLSPITINTKYIYSNNNPINRVDPYGRMSFFKQLTIVIAASVAGGIAGGAAGGAIGGPWGVVAGVVVGAIAGAAAAVVVNGAWNVAEKKKFFEGAGEAALMGAIAGAVAGGMAAYNNIYSNGRYPGGEFENNQDELSGIYEENIDCAKGYVPCPSNPKGGYNPDLMDDYLYEYENSLDIIDSNIHNTPLPDPWRFGP